MSREQVQENKRTILEAAGRLFRARGYEAVTVTDVMKSAGLTHNGFYGYFKSKDDLIAQTLAQMFGATEPLSACLATLAAQYLAPAHRDDFAGGCPVAALALTNVLLRSARQSASILPLQLGRAPRMRLKILTILLAAPALAGPAAARIDAIAAASSGSPDTSLIRTVSNAASSAALLTLLFTQTFEWIDNGRQIGAITFNPDGTARDTWSVAPNTWRLDANGDLLIANAGAVFVTRMTFDGVQGFSGRRDVTSQVQDGVQTVLRAVGEPGRPKSSEAPRRP